MTDAHSEQLSILRSDGGGNRATEPSASAQARSFVRLVLLWAGAVVCGGVTPGAPLFAHLFADAGLAASTCEGTHELCRKQYMLIVGILQGLQGLVLLATLPAGLLLDVVGPRKSGSIGAVMVASGVLLNALALRVSNVLLFTLAVILQDFGAVINNFAFYGFLWHLPRWQALILAASSGCTQVAAFLPVIFRHAMDVLGTSIFPVMLVYASVACCVALLCWFVVPSQKAYYEQAQAVLGMPMPKTKPRITYKKIAASIKVGLRILRPDIWDHVVLLTLTLSGAMALYSYSAMAVPLGRVLFDSKKAAEDLGDLYVKTVAIMGLVGVPVAGLMADVIDLRILPCMIVLALTAVVSTCGTATWAAQKVSVFGAAFYLNAFQLFMIKYFVGIAPPARIGIVVSLFMVLMFLIMIPLIIINAMWVSTFEQGSAEAFVVPMRTLGAVAVVGWSMYCIRLFVRPLPEMVLLPQDEKDMLFRFMLRTLADAEEVLAMGRKEVLRTLASSNPMDQQELLNAAFNSEARERYARLALSRANRLAESTPTGSKADIDIDVGEGFRVLNSAGADALGEALKQSWGGKDETGAQRGEPALEWMLQACPEDHPFRDYLLAMMVTNLMGARLFGQVLAIKGPGDAGVLGFCACWGPEDLQDTQTVPKGSDRWFSLVTRHPEVMQLMDPMGSQWSTLDPSTMDRMMCKTAADMEWHHEQQPPHWYVHLLGVVPRARGKGLSRKLLGVVFAWAKEAAVPVYLECAQKNVPIYKKMGFHEVWTEIVEVETSSIAWYGMLRPAAAE